MYLVSMLELILSGKGNTPRKSPTSFTVGLVTVPPIPYYTYSIGRDLGMRRKPTCRFG